MNGGYPMPGKPFIYNDKKKKKKSLLNFQYVAWFDISGLDKSNFKNEDEQGILNSLVSGKDNERVK